MRTYILSCLLLIAGGSASAQELFTYTEPASNMSAHALGIRVSNWLMQEHHPQRINYHLIPEVMWGAHKNLMLHAEGFISNRGGGLAVEGGALYAKYRLYSKDALYRHFRVAAFARLATNNADIHQEEIETNGHNSGYELGTVLTQLLHRQALSLTLSYERALDNAGGHEFPAVQSGHAVNCALSTGRLILPKKYTGYNQTNFNLMLEALGQSIPESGKHYLDIAPSVQLIFHSQTRIDIGYRRQLWSNMERTAPNGFLLRVEHNLFGVL